MGDQGGDVRALVELIAKALVDNPDGVRVEFIERDDGGTVELRVGEGDLGKVIGKQGRTARSIRTILGAVGTKHQKRVTLEILE